MSTETNPVVESRAKKLGVPCLQSVQNKGIAIQELCVSTGVELEKIMFVGNDLNDISAMEIVNYPVAVADAHSEIKSLSCHVLESKGGDAVVREIIESILIF